MVRKKSSKHSDKREAFGASAIKPVEVVHRISWLEHLKDVSLKFLGSRKDLFEPVLLPFEVITLYQEQNQLL